MRHDSLSPKDHCKAYQSHDSARPCCRRNGPSENFKSSPASDNPNPANSGIDKCYGHDASRTGQGRPKSCQKLQPGVCELISEPCKLHIQPKTRSKSAWCQARTGENLFSKSSRRDIRLPGECQPETQVPQYMYIVLYGTL